MKWITFALDSGDDTEMVTYLKGKGIAYSVSADYSQELIPFDYIPKKVERAVGFVTYGSTVPENWTYEYVVYTFVILGDDEDMTALKMLFNGVTILKNRPWLNVKNFFRSLWPF